jgi:hypothetical protein
VQVVTIMPDGPLGSMRDAWVWQRENSERWIAQGQEAGENISIPNCFWR